MDFENDDNLDYQLNKMASIVIKEKRLKRGYSLDELSDKLDNILTKQSLFRYENNEARMKNRIFKKICIALNENPADVWDEINSRLLNVLEYDDHEEYISYDDHISIPVLGIIKAGIPMEAQQNILENIDIPREWTKGGKKFFGLKISGDSMYPKYHTNDIVIFEQSNDIEKANNKDCAVMVNGDDATFKKVMTSDKGITLIPYNSEYEPLFFTPEEIINKPVRIIGIGREKRTKI